MEEGGDIVATFGRGHHVGYFLLNALDAQGIFYG